MTKTKEISKNKSVIKTLVPLQAYRVLLYATICLGLGSCLRPTRPEINGRIWLNNTPIPEDICLREPSLKDYGFYRKLNDGKLEFVSFCSPEAFHWIAMHELDFKDLLDKYVPEKDRQIAK
jgi:hypothetical protein